MISQRSAAAAGIASGVLLIPTAVVVVLAGDYPQPDAAAVEVAVHYRENRTGVLLSLFCEAISYGFFLWWLAGLRALIPAQLGSLVMGTGVVYAALILVEDAALATVAKLAERAGSLPAIDALWTFAFLEAWPFTRPFVVVFFVAAGVGLRSTSALPKWLAVFAFVTAAVNAVFIPSLFVDSGPYVSGGFLAHVTATLLTHAWIFVASLAMWATPASPSSGRIGGEPAP